MLAPLTHAHAHALPCLSMQEQVSTAEGRMIAAQQAAATAHAQLTQATTVQEEQAQQVRR